MKIALSAGHFPEEPGADYLGFIEHNEAVLWVERLSVLFGNLGDVVPTGHLEDKVAYIKNIRPSIALEVHFNSATDAAGNHIGKGCETLFCPGSVASMHVAEAVQGRLSRVMGKNRGVREGYYHEDPQQPVLYFLRELDKADIPAIIIEPEFVHHYSRIQSKRNEACGAIFSAITDVLRGDF